MAKSGTQTKELQRRLLRLCRLDGRLVACTDGDWLIWPQYVRDPRPLVQALRGDSGLTSTGLHAGLQLQHAPLLLTVRWLAAAQRDLRALQKDPAALAHTQAAARRFRSLPQPTPAWLADRQQRLNELAAELQEVAARNAAAAVKAIPPGQPSTLPAGPPWFLGVVTLVRQLRGPAVATALQLLWRRSAAMVSPAQAAQQRLGGLLERLKDRPERRPEEPALQAFLDGAAVEARSLLCPAGPPGRKRPLGRAQLRRIARLVRRVVFWPAEPSEAHAPELDSAALRSTGGGRKLLAELAAPLLAGLPSGRDPQHYARLAHAVAHYGLLFPAAADDPAWSALDVVWLDLQLGRAITQLAPHGLPLLSALALLKLPGTGDLEPLSRHLAAGLPLELLLRTCQLGYGAELRQFTGPVPALRAYCEWVVQLAPLYQRSGRKLELSPTVTTRFHALREPNLALLVHCLVSSAADATPQGSEVDLQLTVLDAAIGLCGRVPQRAAALVSLLTTWPSGTGQARFPEFASWLADPALLDRYLHLAELAGEPAELSRMLQRDFLQAQRLLSERRYLTGLATLDAKQRQRLDAIAIALASAALPSASWTRRRLGERVADLLGRALRCQLDIVLREVLQKGFGVAPLVLTPAWRDAVRFYLLTERNEELLGTLLRFAATHPGRSPARVLAKNQRWLQRASQHLSPAAWLAVRRTELELDGKRFVLAIEDDPIEVLRMGIPFGTCLSLDAGCNAAAAVCNAADANKRVIYLRDPRGVIVGRKLIAISAEWGLLGYELYLSLEAQHRPAVATAVLALCEALAQAAGIPLALSGVPELIHESFWYDDGPQPFANPQRLDPEVTVYCRQLGQPVPTPSTPNLATEATQWQARAKGSVAQALKALNGGRLSFTDQALGLWIVDQLGLLPAQQTARHQQNLREFVLRRAASQGAPRLLQIAGSWEHGDTYELKQHLQLEPPSALLATALVEAAERGPHRREHPDDHALSHLTFSALGPSLAVTPVAQVLAICDRLEPLWDWFLKAQTGCQPCRESGEVALLHAVRQAYRRQPDPAAVVTCLRSRRPSRLALRTALHLAAGFLLLAGAQRPGALVLVAPPPGPGSPVGLRAVQALGARHSDFLPEPDFLAALLRQSPRSLRIELPTPHRLPFEDLADLLLDPTTRHQVADAVAHLVSGPEDLATYQPGPWELYYLRRQETPLRRRVARAAQALDDHEPAYPRLLGLLADLGDVTTLTGLASRFTSGARSRQVRQALEKATTVAWQVALDAHDLDVPLQRLGSQRPPGADETPTRPQLRDIPDILDPALQQRVLRTIERTLPTAAPVDSEYIWAVYSLTTAQLPLSMMNQLVQQFMQTPRGALDAAELWYINWFLQTKATWELPEVTLELAVALWQVPELRTNLATALANGSQWPRRYHRMQELAQRSGQTVDGLLQQWLPLHLQRDVDTAVGAVRTVADLHLLLDVALAHLPPTHWLAIYQSLGGFAEAASFLDHLRSAHLDPAAIKQLLLLAEAALWHHPDEAARGSWLCVRLKELDSD